MLVVDTLPADIGTGPRREWSDIARRLQLLQRDADIHRLTEHGIPVVPWQGARSLDNMLLNLSRAAVAPRVRS